MVTLAWALQIEDIKFEFSGIQVQKIKQVDFLPVSGPFSLSQLPQGECFASPVAVKYLGLSVSSWMRGKTSSQTKSSCLSSSTRDRMFVSHMIGFICSRDQKSGYFVVWLWPGNAIDKPVFRSYHVKVLKYSTKSLCLVKSVTAVCLTSVTLNESSASVWNQLTTGLTFLIYFNFWEKKAKIPVLII